jgi:acyl dehydratase
MTGLYFDEFKVGDVFRSPGMTVSESEILDFAMRYDPRPYHIDVVAAEATEFGGLIASGFHTLALSFSLLVRSGFLEAANLGSPGLDEVRWIKPLRPGMTIHLASEVTRLQPSRSKPDRGVVFIRHTTIDQNDEVLMTADCIHRVGRRPEES